HPYFRQDRYDVLHAIDECGQEAEIGIKSMTELVAVKWGVIGTLDENGRWIVWKSPKSDKTWRWERRSVEYGRSPITGSVGDGGLNNAADTKFVQMLLNNWLRSARK